MIEFSEFNVDNISIHETDDTKQINIENDLVNFIGHPFDYKINPDLETTHNLAKTNYLLSKQFISSQKQTNLFLVYTQKKRGRIKKSENINVKPHGKFDEDNIIRKIQVSYLNFITDFMNEIIKKIGREDLKFISLNYFYKRKVNKAHRKLLKNQTIKEVLSNDISPKFRKQNSRLNYETCEIIKKENIYILLNILNKEIFFFFDKIYFKNYRNFNLKEFGFDNLEILLPPKVELFEDLLNKNKKEIHFQEYKKRINKCAKKYFLKAKQDIFKCNY